MFKVGDVLVRDDFAAPDYSTDRPSLQGPTAAWDSDRAVELLAADLGFRRWNGPLFLGHVRGRYLELGTLPLLVCEIRPEVAEGVIELFVIGERYDVLAVRARVRGAITGLLGELGLRWLVSVGLPCLDAHRAWDLNAATMPEEIPVQNIESLLYQWDHDGPPGPEDFDEVADCGCEGPHLLESLRVQVGGVEEPWSSWCRVRPSRITRALAFAEVAAPDRSRSTAAAPAPTTIDAP